MTAPTADVLTPLVRLVDGLPVAPTSVGELAVPVPVLAPGTALLELDELFRHDQDLRAVLIPWHGRWQLLSRSELNQVLTGRFGYGRALAARRLLSDLLPLDTLVLPAGTSPHDAADAVLRRTSRTRFDDVVVDHGESARVVPVASLFAALAAAFQQAAVTDALTGLPNRFAVHSMLASAAAAELNHVAALYVDLDRFKEVNDTYGHRVGDEVLVQFSQRLRECVRSGDVAARLGGDEFLVALRDVNATRAAAIGERILMSAAAPFLVEGHVIMIGASVGIALAGEIAVERHLSTPEVLLRHADAAMYRAKAAGRGCVVQLDRAQRPVETGLAAQLRQAIDDGALELHYQPKVAMDTGRIVEFEALCRWQHPERGTIPPLTFIPLAERTGLIVDLGRWVLYQACRQLRVWLDDGADLDMAVNLSPVQVAAEGLVEQVALTLEATGVPARRLRLEITETAAIADVATTAERLARLRALGVRLSLDDFGTGYSSLAMLRSLPLDGVKIDKSFVDNLTTSEHDAALVKMIIDAAHQRGLRVVAEGVEHRAQLDRLQELGCDGAQGYLLGRPMPAEGIDPHDADRSYSVTAGR